MYVRDCHQVDSSDPDDGSVSAEEWKEQMTDIFEDEESQESQITAELKSYSGSAVYCSTDSCGREEDITQLSGVAAILPSMLLVSVLTLLAGFFSDHH
jgi:ABC-type Na+ efflux pump permease subunit